MTFRIFGIPMFFFVTRCNNILLLMHSRFLLKYPGYNAFDTGQTIRKTP